MLQCMGYATDLDLQHLIEVAQELERLVEHTPGKRLTRHHPPADFAEIFARAHEREKMESLQ